MGQEHVAMKQLGALKIINMHTYNFMTKVEVKCVCVCVCMRAIHMWIRALLLTLFSASVLLLHI